MLITSRAAAEYRAFFDLAAADLAAVSLLNCSAGGSSLAAETAGRVLAVDPAYALGRDELAARLKASLADGERIIDAHPDRFDWTWYGDPAHRRVLPRLPVHSGGVDLVLCSHLLFTWSNQFGADWHRLALAELVRMARREVRLFPLVVQGTGDPVPFLGALLAELHAAGQRPVPYRFQCDADQMLVIETAG